MSMLRNVNHAIRYHVRLHLVRVLTDFACREENPGHVAASQAGVAAVAPAEAVAAEPAVEHPAVIKEPENRTSQ